MFAPQPITTAPKDGTDILCWNGRIWIAVRWCEWGGGIWQCSSTGHNLLSESDNLKWWTPMPPQPVIQESLINPPFRDRTIESDWIVVPRTDPIVVGDVVVGKRYKYGDPQLDNGRRNYVDAVVHLQGQSGTLYRNVSSFVRIQEHGCVWWIESTIVVYRCTLGTALNPYRSEHFVDGKMPGVL